MKSVDQICTLSGRHIRNVVLKPAKSDTGRFSPKFQSLKNPNYSWLRSKWFLQALSRPRCVDRTFEKDLYDNKNLLRFTRLAKSLSIGHLISSVLHHRFLQFLDDFEVVELRLRLTCRSVVLEAFKHLYIRLPYRRFLWWFCVLVTYSCIHNQ